MLVIADTTPLNYLILIAYVEFLQTLYGRVMVPQAVLDELQHPQTPPPVCAWITQPPVWFEVQAVYGASDASLQHLDPDEQEAIMLAQERQADLLLMDDWEGRQEAERRALQVTGTLGILERAAIRGLLDLPTALTRLQATNFYVKAEIIQVLLDRDASRKATNG